jgi:hypothetical protein
VSECVRACKWVCEWALPHGSVCRICTNLCAHSSPSVALQPVYLHLPSTPAPRREQPIPPNLDFSPASASRPPQRLHGHHGPGTCSSPSPRTCAPIQARPWRSSQSTCTPQAPPHRGGSNPSPRTSTSALPVQVSGVVNGSADTL